MKKKSIYIYIFKLKKISKLLFSISKSFLLIFDFETVKTFLEKNIVPLLDISFNEELIFTVLNEIFFSFINHVI